MKKIVQRGEDIYNDDVFQLLVQHEVTRSRRYPSPLALIQIEMTPTALDQSGAGNAASIFTAKLNSLLRSVDIPAKGKGNTYSVLLPTTNESGAQSVCERLISVFKNKVSGGGGEVVAYSLQIGGASHFGGESLSSEELFQKAEEALKQSKQKGPNTYVLITK